MKNKSDIILLLSEFQNRLRERSPKFFRVWQAINTGIAVIGGLPTLLMMLGVTLPVSETATIALRIMTFCGAWGVVMNGLPVSVPENLPFTEKKIRSRKINHQHNYGRSIAEIYVKGISINKLMVDNGHAVYEKY